MYVLAAIIVIIILLLWLNWDAIILRRDIYNTRQEIARQNRELNIIWNTLQARDTAMNKYRDDPTTCPQLSTNPANVESGAVKIQVGLGDQRFIIVDIRNDLTKLSARLTDNITREELSAVIAAVKLQADRVTKLHAIAYGE